LTPWFQGDAADLIVSGLQAFDLCNTVACGQAFRWRQVGDSFHGVVRGHLLIAQWDDGVLRVSDHTLGGPNGGGLADLVREYFRLEDDHAAREAELIACDDTVAEAIRYAPGIRILSQDPWECLVSYIISARNFIPNIMATIRRLSERFGERVSSDCYEQEYGIRWHSFPDAYSLASTPIGSIAECGASFRARYISSLAQRVVSGEADLCEISELPYAQARDRLMELPGVGPKIAECVLLSSMRKYEAFPVDVWISRVMRFIYLNDPKASLERMQEYARRRFGELAGFAEQYLFHWARTSRGDYLRKLDQASR
jgi:N-glycosylase/DNA lyase